MGHPNITCVLYLAKANFDISKQIRHIKDIIKSITLILNTKYLSTSDMNDDKFIDYYCIID